MVAAQAQSANFGFLARYDAALAAIAVRAERYFPDDPVTCLMKLRQFGELLAQQLAARRGAYVGVDEPQADLLARLRREGLAERDVIDLFHDLRRLGNEATHANRGDHAAAMTALKAARQLAVYFHRTFGGDPHFRPGPFQPPRPPPDATAELRAEIERLRQERDASLSEAERLREAAALAEAARQAAEERAAAEASDRAVWESLAVEEQAARAALAERLAALQAAAQAAPPAAQQAIAAAAAQAAAAIDLDEAATRQRIDAQLRARLGGRQRDAPLRRRGPARQGPQHGHRRMADRERAGRLCLVRRLDLRRCGRSQAPQQERQRLHRPGGPLRPPLSS